MEEVKDKNVPPASIAEMSKIGAQRWKAIDEATRKVLYLYKFANGTNAFVQSNSNSNSN